MGFNSLASDKSINLGSNNSRLLGDSSMDDSMVSVRTNKLDHILEKYYKKKFTNSKMNAQEKIEALAE